MAGSAHLTVDALDLLAYLYPHRENFLSA